MENQENNQETSQEINNNEQANSGATEKFFPRGVVIAALLILALGLGVWSLWSLNRGGVENTPPLADPSAAEADWQTYRNEEYGFEFKYPAGWRSSVGVLPGDLSLYNYQFESVEDNHSFYLDQNKIQISILDNLENLGLTEMAESASSDVEFSSRELSSITIANRNALKISSDGISDVGRAYIETYYVPLGSNNSKLLVASIYGDQNNFGILDRILSTLQFLD